MPYTLNLYNAICQLYFNKTGRQKLMYMGGCAQVICKYDVILQKGLAHQEFGDPWGKGGPSTMKGDLNEVDTININAIESMTLHQQDGTYPEKNT